MSSAQEAFDVSILGRCANRIKKLESALEIIGKMADDAGDTHIAGIVRQALNQSEGGK